MHRGMNLTRSLTRTVTPDGEKLRSPAAHASARMLFRTGFARSVRCTGLGFGGHLMLIEIFQLLVHRVSRNMTVVLSRARSGFRV